MKYESADSCWTRLDAFKTDVMTRTENYASLTIPSICLPIGFTRFDTDQTHDYQSIGAEAVNNVTNKLMLAMFAPSRPFFKGQAGEKTQAQAAERNLTPNDIRDILSDLEKKAVAKLDELNQRPKLYVAVRHLVIAGNVLLCLDKDMIRTMGLRYWCVKRTADGRVHTLVIRERVKFDELAEDIQAAVLGHTSDDSEVNHYKLIKLQPNGGYRMTQWVDGQQLPMKFDGRWTADKLPYRVLAWNLADESDYGTGLVEEYSGDLEAASVLSEAMVNGGILAAEFRWMINPTGLTSADDFNESQNGDALAGREEDIHAHQGGNPNAIKVIAEVLDRYERRIARGFLLGSAITRDAERVTAEEIRLTANELETSFGGVYSTLAATFQLPIAWWLLDKVDRRAAGADITITVVTGLAALSRNGDLENLRLALNDLAGLSAVPPLLQERINWDSISSFVGQGRGVNLKEFLLSEDQVQKNRDANMARETRAANAQAAGKAAAEQTNQGI